MMRPFIPLATSSVERRALKRRAGDGERKIVNSFRHDGRTLRYTLEGAGQALLFVHGLGGRAENWLFQRAAFAPVRRVIAIDLPGHGRSEGRDVSFDRYWDAIHALCDHLDIERIAKRHPLDDCMSKCSAKCRS
jgi:alpha-beta hydrolase superfamily lysophospholipase